MPDLYNSFTFHLSSSHFPVIVITIARLAIITSISINFSLSSLLFVPHFSLSRNLLIFNNFLYQNSSIHSIHITSENLILANLTSSLIIVYYVKILTKLNKKQIINPCHRKLAQLLSVHNVHHEIIISQLFYYSIAHVSMMNNISAIFQLYTKHIFISFCNPCLYFLNLYTISTQNT